MFKIKSKIIALNIIQLQYLIFIIKKNLIFSVHTGATGVITRMTLLSRDDNRILQTELDLPLLKNDITNILGTQKPVIYSETIEKV